MRVGAGCETGHNEMRMDLISAILADDDGADDEGLEMPMGVQQSGDDLFEVDITAAHDGGAFRTPGPPSASSAQATVKKARAREEESARVLPEARRAVRERMSPGDEVSAATLAQELRVTKLVAQECLVALEAEGMVTAFMPAMQCRLVQRERSESAMSGASEAEDGAESQHSSSSHDEGASEASPAARRSRRSMEPTTPGTKNSSHATPTFSPASATPFTPGRAPHKAFVTRRKASSTKTLPSTPAPSSRTAL